MSETQNSESLDLIIKSEGRVLVIDDDKNIVKLIENNLIVHNFEVISSYNGIDALQLIEMGEDFDLIILDLIMPEFSGYEVARHVRDRYSLMEMPILMLTSKNNVQDIVKGFDCGANDYLPKPFNLQELLARTKTLVKLKQITRANANLIEAIDLKNQFINMTIHDLRNPLGVIKSVLELFKMELNLDSENLELLSLALSSSNLLLNLVDELLEAAKIESGKLSLNTEDLDLHLIIVECIDSFKYNLEKKNQTLEFNPDKEYNFLVSADKTRLKEIIDNLISNAIKYSPLDSKIIVSTTHRIYKSFLFVQLRVKDFGPGLSKTDQSKIFNSFQKLTPKPTGGEPSTGLGLSIVKKLVEYHNGKIWVETELGKGCEFIVEFPAKAN